MEQRLRQEMVQEGRREELRTFDGRGVYEVRTKAWAEAQGKGLLHVDVSLDDLRAELTEGRDDVEVK